VVVAVPARPVRRFDPEEPVHDLDGVHHDGIVRAADAVPDQLKETRVDDLLSGELPTAPRRAVREGEHAGVGIFVGNHLIDSAGRDADVMPGDVGDQRALGGDGPGLYAAFKQIGIVLEKGRCGLVPPTACEVGRHNEGCNRGGERGWGETRGLFPALLLRDGVRVEATEGALALETVREPDGEGNLVELNPAPVRGAVDPEVLGEATIGPLAGPR
jgi:hypothetical protein